MKDSKYKQKLKSNKKKGFTLIEVIIAVSIVVILASLSVPKVTGYIDKAKNAKILNSGKQIYTAAMWSYSDQGNTFNKTKIFETINSTVGISGISETAININSTVITIPFSSDSVSCSVEISTSDNSYTIKKNTNAIFSSR
jgi:type IV pilus assembly protein PilA